MDRQIIYPGQVAVETDLLNTNRNTMIALGKLAGALFGTGGVVNGLVVGPSSPAALTVSVGPGEIYQLANVDNTAYSSLPADTTDTVVKQGIALAAQTLACAAPATAGYSINYLIQATYQDADSGAVVLPYYNASNPTQAYAGPNNNGASQATKRAGIVVVNAKAGTAATTGTQTTPAADTGYIALAVVTVANGQTTITSGNITAVAPASPSTTAATTLRSDLADGVTTGKGAALVQVDGTFTLRGWIANLLTSAGAALIGWVQTGTGAIVRKIQDRLRDTLNAADFGVVGDNATDNQAALQAVITEAQNRGGATILLPPGIVRHTGQILIQCNNIKLRGFGSSMTHDGGTPVYSAGTWLRYVGATAQDQVVFASATGATSQKQLGGGLEDVWLDGNGVATRNLVVRSWNSGEFRNVYCAAATTVCVQVDVQSAALAEANDSQRNVFERIYADAGVSAHGYWLDGASGFGNASFNNFINCTGRHKNGHMFVLVNCDNNKFDSCGGFRVAGGTGLTLELRGSNTAGLVARSNHFHCFSGNGGVTARGTTSYTYASLRNTITGYDTDNSSPTPTIEAGATLAWKRDDAYSFGEAFVQMIVGGTLAGAQNARSALGNESLRIHDGTQNAVRIGNGTQEWAIRIDGSGNLNILRIAGSGAFTVSNVAQANNMVLTAAAAAPSAGQVALGSTTATTVGAAGAASALPSAPLGYLIAYVGTTPVKIPYYN